MILYIIGAAIASVLAAIIIPLRTKKAEDVVYGKLDKVTQVTNVLLTIVYVCLSPACLFLSFVAQPRYDEGILCILGWIISIIVSSTLLFCGIGIGLSVAFRRKGKSKLSYIVQFAGVVAVAIMFILFICTYGNILRPIN